MMSLWVLLSLGVNAAAVQNYSQQILGTWQAFGYYYEDQWIQPDDPQLKMTFNFYGDGTHRLYWQLKTQKNFCENRGNWKIEGDQLILHVTWLNPENGSDCSSDPDMQLGKKTQTAIEIKEDKLFIKIPLADEFLIYVWSIVEDVAPHASANERWD
ncbi:MAG: lipocalin family protein [Bdellovibrionales bacterium]|nr:lipocalin family protein [Bdellovibrionales bacterium]